MRSVLACSFSAVVLAGCGGSSGSTAETPVAAPSSTAPSQAGAVDDCGGGAGVIAAITAALKSYPSVTGVDTSGGCGSLDIATSLTKADVATATLICEGASTIAYAQSLKNVTVTGAANVELAISVKGQPCVGEP